MAYGAQRFNAAFAASEALCDVSKQMWGAPYLEAYSLQIRSYAIVTSTHRWGIRLQQIYLVSAVEDFIQSLQVQNNWGLIFSERENPEHKSSGRESNIFGSIKNLKPKKKMSLSKI